MRGKARGRCDGFFDGLKDVRLRKNDRVEVVASFDQPIAEHATLVIDQVDGAGKAIASLLHLSFQSSSPA
jgi:uncharacterized protein (DUF779 family)